MKNLTIKKIALCGILSALATIAFIIENAFPPLILPSAKMGLSNIFILLSTLILGWQYGFISLIVKVMLGSLFSGNISAILYSLPAGVISLTIEIVLIYLVKKTSILATSILGAVINSTIQNLTFCLITRVNEFLYYLPYLALISVISGFIVGLCVYLIIKKTQAPIEKYIK